MEVSNNPSENWLRATGLQQAMLLASLHPGSAGAYCQQLVVALPEKMNPALFLSAARQCFQRHDALMARFQFREGQLFQTRLPEADASAPEIDLSRTSGTRKERLQEFLESDRLDPLPLLGDRPLWRSRLLRFGGDDVAWLWTHHHSVCDAVSYPLLLTEIFRTYDGLLAGDTGFDTLAAPDFLDHLRWLSNHDWSAQKEVWRRRLDRTDVPTALPEIRAAASSHVVTSDAYSLRLSVEISLEIEENLRRLCDDLGITLNTLVIAACALWMARMQGEVKATFAVMRAARRSSVDQAEAIIGPLVNTVPVRLEVPDDSALGDWLQEVRKYWSGLRALEHSSLAQISEWTGFGAEGLDLPLVVNFQRARLRDQLRAAGLPPDRCQARLFQVNDVPLMLDGYENPHLQIDLIGQKKSVPELTLRAVADGIGAALRAFTAGSNRSLGSIDLLSSNDEKILKAATRGPSIQVPGRPAQELIERRIKEQPETIAIQEPGRGVTFFQFGEIAARVAANIVERGGAKEIVAILLPPSADLLCVMLGSMRSGAAFLLINPELPAEERAAMLRQLPPAFAITAPEIVEETKAVVARVYDFEQITAPEAKGALPQIPPHDLVYLVHTSGSTGEKKFVEVEHRSLADTLSAMVRLYDYHPGDRRLSMGSPGNDYFIGELLVALSGGGTIIFSQRDGGALSIADYLAQLHGQHITISGIPAAYWHEWVRAMDDERAPALPPALRLVICSMEKANPQLLQKWRRLVGDRVQWLNVYGPAEATVAVTAWDPAKSPSPNSINLPIGRPFGNSEMYVLDAQRRRMPVGVCGEIGIAGPVVARGYRNAEEATRQKFVANPFADSLEFGRLYLTGDYGYLNERGEFVFLERRDRQIKLRGYRIELGEIEVVLEEHAQIQQAVATMEGDEDNRRLVAHILPKKDFDPTALRLWMLRRLPAHLRPSDLVTVEKIPVMPTGKVDRRALSAAYLAQIRPAMATELPGATAIEQKVFELWRELLGDRYLIGLTDSFFDLGGNSLLAVRLLSRIEKEFGATPSVHELFTHPTISELATLIEREPVSGNFTSLIRLNTRKEGRPLFVVHGWSGGVFHCLDFARRLNGRRPVLGLQAVEHAGEPRHRSFEEMAKHYADELQRAYSGIAFELFGHSVGGTIAYATACELRRRGENVRRLYLVDTTPCNLPFRVHLRHVYAQVRPRLRSHLKSFIRTPARDRYNLFRHYRNSFKTHLGRWPARKNHRLPPLPADFDYYALIDQDFHPQRCVLEIRLFTPLNAGPMENYWRYLVGDRVENFFVPGDHMDVFEQVNLDTFMPEFERASKD